MKTQLKTLLLFMVFICFSISSIYTQCYELYGLSGEGEFGAGAIYRSDRNDTLSVVTSLSFVDGYWPHGQLCKASNGKLYGMTSAGGKYDFGVIFEWDPLSGLYTKKIDFDRDTNGSFPYGSLIQAENGKLYGMTVADGTYGSGVLFEWDPVSGIYTKKIDFDGENGGKPYGSLVQTDNGLMYGMTSAGGANNKGVLFEWNPVNNNYIKKLDFSGTENGSDPRGSLILADNGKLYGMTNKGGLNGLGVLFEWDPVSNNFYKRIDFNDTVSGKNPEGSLLQADNGKLYGMTPYGGQYDHGILFEWDPENNVFTKKLDFDNAEKGSYPNGSLIKLNSGKLAGTTADGGTKSGGVLFEWDPSSNSFNKKYDLGGGTNGRQPSGSLIQADNGKLYGMTLEGGMSYLWYTFGVLFEWDPSTNSYSVKLKFLDGENGKSPVNMVEANNGKFYGTASSGGNENVGVIFEFDPSTNTYVKKFDFTGKESGMFPRSLINGQNGILYGTTSAGPDYLDIWTIFEWDPFTCHFTQQFYYDESDDGTQKGRYPTGHLILANNGKIYGTTFMGGKLGKGILFEWDPTTGIFTKKFDFDNQVNGRSPNLLVKARNGKLYGTAQTGTGGLLFEWDPATDTLIKKFDFTDHKTVNSLIQAPNNKFYGAANLHTRSILYEWDAESNVYLVKLEFNNNDGLLNPLGNSLTLGENGKLYGTIQDETDYYVFEWDPLNDNFEKKFDINAINGEKIYSLLLKRKNITGTLNAFACGEYLSPSGKFNWSESGVYQDTISSATGCDSIITINLTIKNPSTNTLNTSACERYITPSGKILTNSGEYVDTIPNVEGCDSIITINLTISTADTSVTQDQSVLTANAAGATYQWIDCDFDNTPIEGETHQTFTAIKDGNYAVIVSQFGCTDTSACFTVNGTGFTESGFKQNITIYPNPNDGSFYIDLGKVFSIFEITVTELDGRIIQKEQYSNSRLIEMKTSAFPGMYMIIITSESERAEFKILKR